jgi:hypothetical protein
MTALVLDSGALISADRGDRETVLRLRRAQQAGLNLRTNGVVIAQVWRDSSGRQANLARLLKSVDIRAVDEKVGRAAGDLIGRAGTRDAVDGTVVAIAATGDRILTSDPKDISQLVAASGRSILVVIC